MTAQKHLDTYSKTLKKEWEHKLEEKLKHKMQLIENKNVEVENAQNQKINELKSKDSDAINKL